MAFYLTALIEFSSVPKAKKYVELLARKTRPMFADEVADEYQAAFEVIEDVEYPDSFEVNERQLLLRWIEKDYFGAEELVPLFEINDIALIVCHEIDDDADSGDDYEEDVQGRYIYQKEGGGFQVVKKTGAISKFGEELISRVSKFVA